MALSATKTAAFFEVGDLILFGKYKNKPGKIIGFGQDKHGSPTVIIEPIPKGRKQNKEMGLFRIWHNPPPGPNRPVSATAHRIAATFLLRRNDKPHSIWVNVYDECPPEALIEVDFDFRDGGFGMPTRNPFPLDTRFRVEFLRWLQAQTEAAGYKVRAPSLELRDPREGLSKTEMNLRVPAVKCAHIEHAFYVENPAFPGQMDIAPWNEASHHEFLARLIDLYQGLGLWMGIPLVVSCDS